MIHPLVTLQQRLDMHEKLVAVVCNKLLKPEASNDPEYARIKDIFLKRVDALIVFKKRYNFR